MAKTLKYPEGNIGLKKITFFFKNSIFFQIFNFLFKVQFEKIPQAKPGTLTSLYISIYVYTMFKDKKNYLEYDIFGWTGSKFTISDAGSLFLFLFFLFLFLLGVFLSPTGVLSAVLVQSAAGVREGVDDLGNPSKMVGV